MLLGVIMSILIIGPLMSFDPAAVDIFEGNSEYINYEEKSLEITELTEKQTRELYENSVRKTVEDILGEKAEVEIIFSEEEIEKIIIHKIKPEKTADIAAALGVFPSKIQMTE